MFVATMEMRFSSPDRETYVQSSKEGCSEYLRSDLD